MREKKEINQPNNKEMENSLEISNAVYLNTLQTRAQDGFIYCISASGPAVDHTKLDALQEPAKIGIIALKIRRRVEYKRVAVPFSCNTLTGGMMMIKRDKKEEKIKFKRKKETRLASLSFSYECHPATLTRTHNMAK